MGHCMKAIIGKHEAIKKIENDWVYAEEVRLPQGYGMVFLTDMLFDDITELSGTSDETDCPELAYFTAAVRQFLQQYSFHGKLAYVETDYFGGTGTQSGVLYENGQLRISPRSGNGTINLLLKELGVRCMPDKDEFDSLHLGEYRHMPQA